MIAVEAGHFADIGVNPDIGFDGQSPGEVGDAIGGVSSPSPRPVKAGMKANR